jgi:hypothetical protein
MIYCGFNAPKVLFCGFSKAVFVNWCMGWMNGSTQRRKGVKWKACRLPGKLMACIRSAYEHCSLFIICTGFLFAFPVVLSANSYQPIASL